MVLPDSHRIPRVPWYSGILPRKIKPFRLRDYHPLWLTFPGHSTMTRFCNFPRFLQKPPAGPHNPTSTTVAALTCWRFRLFPFRSPLLRESRFLSFPGGTEMFHFPPFASYGYVFTIRYCGFATVGFPIRRSPDQSLFAAPRGLSQLATSFIATWHQGIHRMPLVA